MIKWYCNWKIKRQIRKGQIELLAKELLEEIINTPDFKFNSWEKFYYKNGIFYHTHMVLGEGGGSYQTDILSLEEIIKVCYRSAKSRLKIEQKDSKKQQKIDSMRLKNKTQIEMIQLMGGLNDK